jgi:hypothetical protein
MMVLKLGMISVPGVCCTTRTQFHDPRTFYIPDGNGYHVGNQNSGHQWKLSCLTMTTKQTLLLLLLLLLLLMMMMTTLIMTCLFTVVIQ